MANQRGNELVDDLLANPEEFDRRGRSYDLLQEYFHGFPLETLRPLLKNRDALVQRAAAFVGSELGKKAAPLVDDFVPLISSGNRYLAYHAMEVLVVCARGALADRFSHVLKALECDDEVLRALAMRLVSRADLAQIGAAASALGAARLDAAHDRGLFVLRQADQATAEGVEALLDAPWPLDRKYGGIAARRLALSQPALVERAALSEDTEVRRFIADTKGVGTLP